MIQIHKKAQVGEKHNRLTLICKDTKNSKRGRLLYLYSCDCGKIISNRTDQVRNGSVKSCGCLQKESRFKDPGLASLKTYYGIYREASRVRSIEFNLSFEEFKNIVNKNCHYCNAKPSLYNKYMTKNGNFRTAYSKPTCSKITADRAWIKVNGIDRVDNSVGYINDNVVPCCKTCNLGKHTMSYKEFLIYLDNLVKFRVEKTR